MVEPRSHEGDGATGLRVERVDVLPTDLGRVLVRVAGRWTGDPAPGAPVLLVADRRFDPLPETSGAASRAAPETGAFRAAFSVGEELRRSVSSQLRLEVGGIEVTLPAPAEGGAPATSGATVIDRGVLAERRARRAELAEETNARRADDAEEALATLEGELGRLELRLESAMAERAALEVQVAEATRETRAASQRAHAERRRREGVEEAARDTDVGAQADPRTAVLRTERALASRRAERVEARAATAVDPAALGTLLDAEGRAARARVRIPGDEPLREEARRAAAAVADAGWAVAEARDALAEAGATIDAERALRGASEAERAGAQALAERERERAGRLADELKRERADTDRLRAQLARRAERQERADLAMAELGARIDELQGLAARARQADENEAALREIAGSAGAALEEAERRIEEARRAAADMQDAEHALRASLCEQVDAATAALRTDLEGRVSDLERALASERKAREEAEATLAAHQASREPAASAPASRPAPAPHDAPSPAPGPVVEDEGQGEAPAPADRPAPPPAELPRVAPWLPGALRRLAARDPDAAERLGVELLPAQALRGAIALDYDLETPKHGWHAVSLREGGGAVGTLDQPRARREADFRLSVDAAGLVEVLAGSGPRVARRAGRARVRGTLRRRRALKSIPPASLDLADLAAAGVWPDPGLILTALALLVDPKWTGYDPFAVALEVVGPRGGRWGVVVPGRAPLEVRAGRPERAAATVRMPQATFHGLLAGRPGATEGKAAIRGDVAALARLVEWIERAQREAG